MRLFVICTIFQNVTQNITLTRQITLYFIVHVLITRYTLLLGVHVCDKVIQMDRIQQARLAQSVEHKTRNLRVVGTSPTVIKDFSFSILFLPTRSWRYWFHANEVRHDVHPRYIGA